MPPCREIRSRSNRSGAAHAAPLRFLEKTGARITHIRNSSKKIFWKIAGSLKMINRGGLIPRAFRPQGPNRRGPWEKAVKTDIFSPGTLNRSAAQRPFRAVQAVWPAVKTLVQGQQGKLPRSGRRGRSGPFTCPGHFESKGGGSRRPPEPQKEDMTCGHVLLLGAAVTNTFRFFQKVNSPRTVTALGEFWKGRLKSIFSQCQKMPPRSGGTQPRAQRSGARLEARSSRMSAR